jgi:hypothetical protein
MLEEENTNEDIEPHAQIDGNDILNFLYKLFPHPSSQVERMGGVFGDVPFNRSLHIPLFTLQKLKDMNMGDVCDFNYHVVLASMHKPMFPHQVHI